MCLQKNLTNLAHVCDFITMSICFQSGGKRVFRATLVITSWTLTSAFLMCLRSQNKESPGSMGWLGTVFSHLTQAKHKPYSHNWCQRPTDSITDEDGTQEKDGSANTITRNTKGKSNQCWPNGKWQNKKGENSVCPGSLDRGPRLKWSQNWKWRGKAGIVHSKFSLKLSVSVWD